MNEISRPSARFRGPESGRGIRDFARNDIVNTIFMRILMLAQFYWPDVGGEERHVQDLSEALVARGHEVAVATIWHAGLPEFEVKNGVRVHRLRSTMQRASGFYSTVRQHAPPFPDPELTLGLRRVVAQERPEIVHAHNWILYSFLPLKGWSRARLVVTIHDHSKICPRKTLMQGDDMCTGPGLGKCLACAKEQYGPIKSAVTVLGHAALAPAQHRAVDKYFVVSRDVAERDDVIKLKLPYEVVPNFLPDEYLDGLTQAPPPNLPRKAGEEQDSPPARREGLGEGVVRHQPGIGSNLQLPEKLPAEPFILFAGDVRVFKGVRVLLNAYRQLTTPPPLVLAGRLNLDIPTAEIEAVPGVVALDRMAHDVLTEVRRRSMLAVQPSIGAETFGIVILEAMAAGKAVIGSRIGGIPDVIAEGETGLLVPPGDVTALRDAMARLLADEPLRRRFGQAGRQRAELFRASAVVSQIEDQYGRLLRGNE